MGCQRVVVLNVINIVSLLITQQTSNMIPSKGEETTKRYLEGCWFPQLIFAQRNAQQATDSLVPLVVPAINDNAQFQAPTLENRPKTSLIRA